MAISTTPPISLADLQPDLDEAVQLVLELMAVPGGSGQERAVADAITQHLLAAGAPAAAIRTDGLTAARRWPATWAT